MFLTWRITVEIQSKQNFLRISFLWYLLPMNFTLFLCVMIILKKLGNGNVKLFHMGKLIARTSDLFIFILYVLMRP